MACVYFFLLHVKALQEYATDDFELDLLKTYTDLVREVRRFIRQHCAFTLERRGQLGA